MRRSVVVVQLILAVLLIVCMHVTDQNPIVGGVAKFPLHALHAAPSPLPLWPDAYCLDDRASDSFLAHWFLITIGGLFDIYRPGSMVRLYLPWLNETENPGGLKSYHSETMELLKRDFEFVLRAPLYNAFESCLTWGGLDLFHNDRIMPEAGLVFYRDIFRDKLTKIAPFAPMDERNLYYITRKGAGNGSAVQSRQGMEKRRNVENEDDFLPQLVAIGFTVIQLEFFNVQEKIRLFASARMIVGPQSASFTFSAFMDERADLIEVMPDVDHMFHYCYLTRVSRAYWQRYTHVKTVGCEPDLNYGNGPFNIIIEPAEEFVKHIQYVLANPDKRKRATTCKKKPIYFPDD
jgi:hypothetical protein